MASSVTMASRAAQRRLSGSCPRMDSICEGSDEGSASSSEGETDSTSGSLLTHRSFAMRNGSAEKNARQNQKTGFVPGRQNGGTSDLPGVDIGGDVNSSTAQKSRVSCVETGTNTSSVERHDKATSTDGVCSVVVDGKMAACISKLRTVSQRLEQQQPSTPRNTSPPESSPIVVQPQPVNHVPSPPRVPSPTSSSQPTLPPTVTSTDGAEQAAADQEDEFHQFISKLKSQTQPAESKRLTQSVPGRRFAVDGKRAGNPPRLDRVPESPTSSPRPRRSVPPTDRPAPSQRSYSPRARALGRALELPTAVGGPHDIGSPTQRRSVATKKLPGVSSPPAMRSGGRFVPTDRTAKPHRAKTEPYGPVGPTRSPGSSPRQSRPSVTPTRPAATQRLATVDDEQAKSTSDSDSMLTHSSTSSDDQEAAVGAARPPATPKLARKQRIDMTHMLLLNQQTGGPTTGTTTGVRQVPGSPNTARRATSSRQN